MERRFVITADWHLDTFQNLGLLGPDMLTQQSKYIEKAIYEIKDYMLKNGIKIMLILGDIYHRRNIRPDAVNNLVDKIFFDLELAGIECFIVVGNHDQSNLSGSVDGVQRLSSKVCGVYSTPTIETILGIDFVIIPFMEHRLIVGELEKLRKTYSPLPKIFLGHIGLDGSKVGTFEKKIMEPINLAELYPDDFIYMYFGHYHHSQQTGESAMYVGAPVQHNYGDSGSNRGFWDVNIVKDSNGWIAENTFIPIEITPKFYSVSIEDFNMDNYREFDHIKVTGISVLQRVELQEKYPNITLEGEDIAVSDEEIVLNMGDTWEDWVETWVNENMDNRRKRRSLVKMGIEIAGKVGE